MNAKELRLGNIIQDEKGNYFRVDGLADDRVRTTADGVRWYMPVIFSGVPITEEILKKCKFVEMAKNGNYLRMTYIKDVNLHWRKMEKDGVPFISYRGIEYDNIQYLHQLQNLYFSITNKELEVKL